MVDSDTWGSGSKYQCWQILSVNGTFRKKNEKIKKMRQIGRKFLKAANHA